MRIIAGQYKGKRLHTPKDGDIRPTSDRARESLFNILEHGLDGEVVRGCRVMDICCGTGALGLEALSRGAEHATFIDNNQLAIGLTKKNVMEMGAGTKSEVTLANAVQLPAAKHPVSLVMTDPPYGAEIFAMMAESLKKGGWIKKGSIITIEQDSKSKVPEVAGLELIKERKYGKARLCIFEVS